MPINETVATTPALAEAAANLVLATGILHLAKVHLAMAPVTISPRNLLSDFTEADYTGYVAQSVGTWGAPYVGPDGLVHVTAPSLQFQPSDAVAPNTIYAIYYTDTGGTFLLGAALVDPPVSLPDALHALTVEPDWVILGANASVPLG